MLLSVVGFKPSNFEILIQIFITGLRRLSFHWLKEQFLYKQYTV